MIEATLGAVDGRALLISLGQGFALGLPASALFFAGLAWSTRRALTAARPAVILLASFAIRATALLGASLILLRLSQPLAALLAYVLAFFIVRTIAVHWIRSGSSNLLPQQPRSN